MHRFLHYLYRLARSEPSHTRNRDLEEENNVDPDDGKTWVCDACRLPIFSTPFTTVDRNRNLHDQCANLPAKLEGHPLHPGADLILHQQTTSDNNENIYHCFRCHSKCGSRFYKCKDYDNCRIQFDLACALTIRIIHRSHKHKLTAMMGSSLSFICAACGTQHRPPHFVSHDYSTPWELSYVCSLCDFWIHPDCALLPNAIVIDKHHPHPLLLSYFDLRSHISKCAICNQRSKVHGLGMYACFHCRYLVHIKCAIYSDPHGVKRVLLREAQVPSLLRLPMPNEDTSVMLHMTKTTVVTNVDGASTSTSSSGHHPAITGTDEHQIDGNKLLLFENDKIHEHPLIFHDHHEDGHLPVVDRVCDACVQLISPSDPFYSCSNNNNTNNERCTNFFLHGCCAHLPDTYKSTPTLAHYVNHPLSLFTKVNTKNPFNLFKCSCCRRRFNGFAYACKKCDFYLDVVCALMPVSITHGTHGKSHILHGTKGMAERCNCCKRIMWSDMLYECNNCRNFSLHRKCALFPHTVRHRFDRHPLKLITTARADRHLVADMFCEICEKGLDDRRWHYGCKDCDQSFHIDCIPSLDDLSKIKFGYTVRVRCHDCPVAAVRALSVDGYRCGQCEQIIRESDEIAFECSECYFRIHEECAKKTYIGMIN